jgi:phage-related minor tail protein
MKKSLDSNILQTKTAETIIDLLKKAREITKDNTNYAKGINKDIDFIIKCHKTAKAQARRGRRPVVVSGNHFTGSYKVNL